MKLFNQELDLQSHPLFLRNVFGASSILLTILLEGACLQHTKQQIRSLPHPVNVKYVVR